MNADNKLTVTVTRVLILSLFACCLLAGVSWYFVTVQQVRVPYMPPYELPKEVAAVEMDTSTALKYPLFWNGRRPVAEPEQEPEKNSAVIEPESIDGVQLLGIIVRDSVRTALLGIDKKIQKVVKGDEVKGWVVEQVSADKIVLVANDQIAELSIVRERPNSIKLEPVVQ